MPTPSPRAREAWFARALLSESAHGWTADPEDAPCLRSDLQPGVLIVIGLAKVWYRPEELDFELGVTHAHP